MERARLSQIYSNTLVTLGRRCFADQQFDDAVRWFQLETNKNPWNEEAQRLLMMVFVRSGQRSQALRQYEICATALHLELDVEPSIATNQLLDQIASGEFNRDTVIYNPILYYSCCICYSSYDQQFVDRLYKDLKTRGITCWYALEDMKIGDEIRTTIDQAIRIHDKLLLILSKHSVHSRWVQSEVETAFEQEIQNNRALLFPIRLDEVVMDTDEAWAADIRRQKHIGDFTQWKEHDAYQKALKRLLRDLKAEG